MTFIITEGALEKINKYGLNEFEIRQELQDRIRLSNEGFFKEYKINYKNKDLVILPVGDDKALIIENGKEINVSIDELPRIKYINEKWVKI